MASDPLLDNYLPYLLQKADHLLSKRFHSSLQEAGVQVSEWRVLAVLADHGSLSVQQVADIALLFQPTASHACRRLENDGLLNRVENSDDRRRKMLSLTDDGQELVDGLTEQARAFESEALARLSVDSADLAAKVRALIAELS